MTALKISEKTFIEFTSKHSYKSYFQNNLFADALILNNKNSFYVGFMENNKLIGAALVEISNSFLGIRKAKISRGILIDYTKTSRLKAALLSLKGLLNREGIFSVTINPQVVLAVRDKNGKVIKHNAAASSIIKTFKEVGAVHRGFTFNDETEIPRFEAHVNIEGTPKELFKKLNKEVRNKLRKSLKYGVRIYLDKEKNIDKFWFLIKKDRRTYRKYKALIEAFGDKAEIYYGLLDTNIYVENAKKLYENEIEINAYLTGILENNTFKGKSSEEILSKKLESDKLLYSFKKHLTTATRLIKKHPKGIISSMCLIIKHGIEVYLIEDVYNKEISHIPAGFLNRWKVMERYANSEYKIFNMGFIAGKAQSRQGKLIELTNMKLSFGAYQIEYIGEFDLVINPPAYLLLK